MLYKIIPTTENNLNKRGKSWDKEKEKLKMKMMWWIQEFVIYNSNHNKSYVVHFRFSIWWKLRNGIRSIILYGSGKKAVATNPKTLTGGTFRTHSFPQK